MSPARALARSFAPLLVFGCLAPAAHATGIFQHGGRGAGQVGAFVARADDPSAISYNPAGLTGQIEDGVLWRIQIGLDFSAPRDDFFNTAQGVEYAAKHQINPPPAFYISWVPAASERFTVGVGFDSPFFHNVEWLPALFTERTQNWRTQFLLFELHPVVAMDLGSGWSIGGGPRYVFGDAELGRDVALVSGPPPLALPQALGEKVASATADGFGADFGIRKAGDNGGFGAVVRSAVEVSGSAKLKTRALNGASGPTVDAALALERSGPGDIGFELPLEVRAGFWRGFGGRYRVEGDIAWQAWSATDNRIPSLPSCRPACESQRDRDWDDTLSVRAALEVAIRENLDLYGGIALEPSPVKTRTREPGFPRGDAQVAAIGIGYEIPVARMRLDLGYSFFQYDNTRVANGTYSSHDQVFSFSVRRDF